MKILTLASGGELRPPELAPGVWVWDSWPHTSAALGEPPPPPPIAGCCNKRADPTPHRSLRGAGPNAMGSGELALTLA